MNLSKAIALASNCFIDITDKGGNPYILHCLYVMNKVSHLGETAMIAAVLHDIVEDCEHQGITFEYLTNAGYSNEVIDLLRLLTRKADTNYMTYIKAIAAHPIAAVIKIADLEHNCKITRLNGLHTRDFDRLQKYATAYDYLKSL